QDGSVAVELTIVNDSPEAVRPSVSVWTGNPNGPFFSVDLPPWGVVRRPFGGFFPARSITLDLKPGGDVAADDSVTVRPVELRVAFSTRCPTEHRRVVLAGLHAVLGVEPIVSSEPPLDLLVRVRGEPTPLHGAAVL